MKKLLSISLLLLLSGVFYQANGQSVYKKPPANVTKTDITATNGVIHIIDKVLIP